MMSVEFGNENFQMLIRPSIISRVEGSEFENNFSRKPNVYEKASARTDGEITRDSSPVANFVPFGIRRNTKGIQERI